MVSVNSFTLEAIACANEIYRINIIITSGFTLTKIIFLNWATWTTIFTTVLTIKTLLALTVLLGLFHCYY